MITFAAETFHNRFLPIGGTTVDAIVTVSATGGGGPRERTAAAEILIIDTSGSMDYPPSKLAAAKKATEAAIDCIADGVLFGVLGGRHDCRVVYPDTGFLVDVVRGHPPPGEAGGQAADRRRWHGVRSVVGPRPATLPGDATGQHPPCPLVDRRSERVRGAGRPGGVDRLLPGAVPMRLPRRRDRLGGGRAPPDRRCPPRDGRHHPTAGGDGRRVHRDHASGDGEGGRRRRPAGLGPHGAERPRSTGATRDRRTPSTACTPVIMFTDYPVGVLGAEIRHLTMSPSGAARTQSVVGATRRPHAPVSPSTVRPNRRRRCAPGRGRSPRRPGGVGAAPSTPAGRARRRHRDWLGR